MQSPAASPSFVVRQWMQICRARCACAIAAVIVLIQLVVLFSGGTNELVAWYERFGLSRDGVFSGKIWQLLTHGLLHGNAWHVGINALLVVGIGSRIEVILGGGTLVRVMLLGLLVGGLGHLCISDFTLVGISGGCFALLLLLFTLSPESRMFPLPVSARNLGWGIVVTEAFLVLVHPDLKIPGFELIGEALIAGGAASLLAVSHACHIGGAVSGWLFGRWLLRNRVTLEVLQRQRAKRED